MEFFRSQTTQQSKKNENEDKLVLNITYHPSLAQLKIITARIHLHLTPNNEHNNVFKDVLIIAFRREKSLKEILVTSDYLKLKTKVGEVLVKDLDVKISNILYLRVILHDLLQNAHMILDQKI